MKLLNLGCGGHRPQGEEWWNLDELRKHLKPGTPERTNLDGELRYIECSLTVENIPMQWGTVDGILCQHVIEHFACHDAVHVIKECHTLLRPGGWLCVSVPDANYFLENYYRDSRENAVRVFGEPISVPHYTRFFDYALFHHEHMQVLTEPALRCLLIAGGFDEVTIYKLTAIGQDGPDLVATKMRQQLNRTVFSVILFAMKRK